MSLPAMPASSGGRNRWRFAIVALVVLLAAGAPGRSGHAADDDPFSATVTVDATAENVVKARETARLDGQRRALVALAERLGAADAQARLAKLDDNAVGNLVASFEVANERMSAVRYVADYTFHFHPAQTRNLLQKVGVALSDETGKAEPSKPVILIPVYQAGAQATLWDDPNPWRDAWSEQPSGPGPTKLLAPLGDAGDIAAIDAAKAQAGDPDALVAIARHNGGDEAIVALAQLRGAPDKPAGLDVTVRRYRAGQPLDNHFLPIGANPGESQSDLLHRAVAAVATALEGGWKKEPVPRYDQQGSLTAVLPITSLDDWLHARERLAAVPVIRKIAVVALSRQEATIEIGYVGSIDQLKAALAAISLDLVRGDPLWRLAHSGPSGTP